MADGVLERARSAARSRVRRVIGWRPYAATDEPPCALCGGYDVVPLARRVAHDMRYRTVVCRGCGLVFISPRPSAQDFDRYYEDLFFTLFTGRRRIEATVLSQESIRRGREVYDFLEGDVGSGMLDIGCGDGGLLAGIADRLAEDGVTKEVALFGCDPGRSSDAPRELERAGRTIRFSTQGIEELVPELGRFDVFVLFDVIEHLLDPRGVLEKLHPAAPPDARLFAATSCLDNWREIPRGGLEGYYLRLGHTYTWTQQTLQGLLASTGWRVCRRRPALKGDQWILARRDEPLPTEAQTDPSHWQAVQQMVASYRERCR